MADEKKKPKLPVTDQKSAQAYAKGLKVSGEIHLTEDGLPIKNLKAARRYAKKNDKKYFTINV